eukprot:2740702-Pleurochrysis_carterae.AAC.5
MDARARASPLGREGVCVEHMHASVAAIISARLCTDGRVCLYTCMRVCALAEAQGLWASLHAVNLLAACCMVTTIA